MKFAVLSDIHANLEALEVALEAIDKAGIRTIYCLGDVVGYGADPVACLAHVRDRCRAVVRGNHDEAVATGRGLELLPPDGQAAARRHADELTQEQRAYLAGLPLQTEDAGCTFVHASPEAPDLWQRLESFPATRRQFDHFSTDLCFVGHTHCPGIAANRVGVFDVRRGHRYLINVGSVGQPRDGDPRLSFAIFDMEAFSCEIVRLPYDVGRAAEKIRQAGLPEALARRLARGR